VLGEAGPRRASFEARRSAARTRWQHTDFSIRHGLLQVAIGSSARKAAFTVNPNIAQGVFPGARDPLSATGLVARQESPRSKVAQHVETCRGRHRCRYFETDGTCVHRF
jgi:hypothetical protein